MRLPCRSALHRSHRFAYAILCTVGVLLPVPLHANPAPECPGHPAGYVAIGVPNDGIPSSEEFAEKITAGYTALDPDDPDSPLVNTTRYYLCPSIDIDLASIPQGNGCTPGAPCLPFRGYFMGMLTGPLTASSRPIIRGLQMTAPHAAIFQATANAVIQYIHFPSAAVQGEESAAVLTTLDLSDLGGVAPSSYHALSFGVHPLARSETIPDPDAGSISVRSSNSGLAGILAATSMPATTGARGAQISTIAIISQGADRHRVEALDGSAGALMGRASGVNVSRVTLDGVGIEGGLTAGGLFGELTATAASSIARVRILGSAVSNDNALIPGQPGYAGSFAGQASGAVSISRSIISSMIRGGTLHESSVVADTAGGGAIGRIGLSPNIELADLLLRTQVNHTVDSQSIISDGTLGGVIGEVYDPIGCPSCAVGVTSVVGRVAPSPRWYNGVQRPVHGISGGLNTGSCRIVDSSLIGSIELSGTDDQALLPTNLIQDPLTPELSCLESRWNRELGVDPEPVFYRRNCPADINDSGTVSVQDIFVMLSLWFSGEPDGDFNESGSWEAQDIFEFLGEWFAAPMNTNCR